MIYKISPAPSLPKRGREKAEMTHSLTRRAGIKNREVFDDWSLARIGSHIAGNRVVPFPDASGKSASDGKVDKK